jgi:hypothetical protein
MFRLQALRQVIETISNHTAGTKKGASDMAETPFKILLPEWRLGLAECLDPAGKARNLPGCCVLVKNAAVRCAHDLRLSHVQGIA